MMRNSAIHLISSQLITTEKSGEISFKPWSILQQFGSGCIKSRNYHILFDHDCVTYTSLVISVDCKWL